MKYKTPQALEQAVKAAAKRSNRDTNKAIQDFYRDRFLCRIFLSTKTAFVLKGGQSMLAKVPDARETKDIDLLGRATDLNKALEELKDAASVDLDDFLEFRYLDAIPTDTSQNYREGYTVKFETWLGGTKRAGIISIDLVVDPFVSNDYETLSPVSRLAIEGLVTCDYIVNTAEVRVAEKVCAVMQIYATGPSSRVKDLVDLVTSMRNERVNADKLKSRIAIECAFRRIDSFTEFVVPENWKTIRAANYRKLAREAHLPAELEDVSVAEAAVASWLRVVLTGEAIGLEWDPLAGVWC